MKHFLSKVKKSCKRFMTGKSGFSLVELIVVIAIMAVMAAVLAPALLGYVERSRAQKDDSAMGEVTNAIQLSLADQNVYDELLPYAVKGNFSCYADGDTSTNIDANKTVTKAPDYWLFTDEARKLDETPYQPAGSMRGATVTFKPNGSAEYILKDGIVNQIGDESTKKGTNGGAILEDCPELYNRLRSTVGDTIKVSSQTYRNSTYTIFISMGTTGGNQADKQDAIQVYGQYNGTNLPEVMTATGSATQDKGNAGSGGSEQIGPPDDVIEDETKTIKLTSTPNANCNNIYITSGQVQYSDGPTVTIELDATVFNSKAGENANDIQYRVNVETDAKIIDKGIISAFNVNITADSKFTGDYAAYLKEKPSTTASVSAGNKINNPALYFHITNSGTAGAADYSGYKMVTIAYVEVEYQGQNYIYYSNILNKGSMQISRNQARILKQNGKIVEGYEQYDFANDATIDIAKVREYVEA